MRAVLSEAGHFIHQAVIAGNPPASTAVVAAVPAAFVIWSFGLPSSFVLCDFLF